MSANDRNGEDRGGRLGWRRLARRLRAVRRKRRRAVQAAIVLAAAAVFVVDDVRTARENGARINPAVPEAFRAIERGCLEGTAQPGPAGGAPCREVRRLVYANAYHTAFATGEGMPADEYYEVLGRLGFELPPYYEPGYSPRRPLWRQFPVGVWESFSAGPDAATPD